MKKVLTCLFLTIALTGCGTWVDVPDFVRCTEKEAKKQNEEMKKEGNSWGIAFYAEICMHAGKSFTGEVRCNDLGVMQVKCK